MRHQLDPMSESQAPQLHHEEQATATTAGCAITRSCQQLHIRQALQDRAHWAGYEVQMQAAIIRADTNVLADGMLNCSTKPTQNSILNRHWLIAFPCLMFLALPSTEHISPPHAKSTCDTSSAEQKPGSAGNWGGSGGRLQHNPGISNSSDWAAIWMIKNFWHEPH